MKHSMRLTWLALTSIFLFQAPCAHAEILTELGTIGKMVAVHLAVNGSILLINHVYKTISPPATSTINPEQTALRKHELKLQELLVHERYLTRLERDITRCKKDDYCPALQEYEHRSKEFKQHFQRYYTSLEESLPHESHPSTIHSYT